jgi:hypothetical protein
MLALVLAMTIDAETLMTHVATIAEATVTIRKERQLSYTKKLIGDETKVWEASWKSTGLMERLISVDGHAVHKTLEPSKDMDFPSIMRSRFHFAMADPPEQNGPECNEQPCYAVTFWPKTADELTPADRLNDPDAELLVGHLAGTVYVDQEHLYLIRIIGHLSDAGPFKKGSVTWIKGISVDYRQELFQDIPVLTDSNVQISATFLGFPAGDHRVYEYRNYCFAYPPAP